MGGVEERCPELSAFLECNRPAEEEVPRGRAPGGG